MNIKDDLVRHYHWLRQYGLNDSHSGNASVREGDAIWITPTGCCADTLSSGELVECRPDGVIGKGASMDARLHLAVYQANPDTRAVLHSHGPYSVAMTMDNDQPTDGVRDTAQPAGMATASAASVAMPATSMLLRNAAVKAAPALFSTVGSNSL